MSKRLSLPFALALLLYTTDAAPMLGEDQWEEKAEASHNAQTDGVVGHHGDNPHPMPEDLATPAPEPNEEELIGADSCETWCASNAKTWTTKCNWSRCKTCSDCASLAPPPPPCIDKNSRCAGWKSYCKAQSGKSYQVGGESLEIYCAATCTDCVPTPTPPPTPPPTEPKTRGTFACVPEKSVAKCGKCMETKQCASGYYLRQPWA